MDMLFCLCPPGKSQHTHSWLTTMSSPPPPNHTHIHSYPIKISFWLRQMLLCEKIWSEDILPYSVGVLSNIFLCLRCNLGPLPQSYLKAMVVITPILNIDLPQSELRLLCWTGPWSCNNFIYWWLHFQGKPKEIFFLHHASKLPLQLK